MRIKIDPESGPGKLLAPFSHTINAIPAPVAKSSGGLTTIAGTAMTCAGSDLLGMEGPAQAKGIMKEVFNVYRMLGSQGIADFSQNNPFLGGASNCVIGSGSIGFGENLGDFMDSGSTGSKKNKPKSPS